MIIMMVVDKNNVMVDLADVDSNIHDGNKEEIK